jgi:cyanophycin synthetase
MADSDPQTATPAHPSGTLTLHVFDSRRQVGPNLLHDGPGAALELVWGEDRSAMPGGDHVLPAPAAGAAPDAPSLAALDALLDDVVARWRRCARTLLDALAWDAHGVFVRRFAGSNQSGGPLRGATLAVSAPLDGLWTATEVCEHAVRGAVAGAGGVPFDEAAAIEALRASHRKEARRRTGLVELAAEAGRRGVSLLADDRRTSIGTGTGSLSFDTSALPAPGDVDWASVHDVPVVFVTGTNGKSTTVRLAHAIALAAGRVAGLTSTDWIRVGPDIVERGDCAGPDGARTLLRDRRVELAICETARGGILRRGLVLPRADAAIVTNAAEDHLGQWGVLDLPAMIDTKAVLGRLVERGGRTGRAPLIVNADDAGLARRAAAHDGELAWFTLHAGHPAVAAHVARGGTAALLERAAGGAAREVLVLRRGARRDEVVGADELPVAFGGAARHNLANALAALLAADALGLPLDAMARGLRGFVADAEANPGRGNRYELGGVTALADFAHNVHAMTALVETFGALPARRRLLILGQAGDRSDDAIRALVGTAWRARPDRILVKEQHADLRGRRPGEVPAVIEAELARLGADPASVSRASSEREAVLEALRWAQPGDLLGLFLHSERDACLALLDELRARHWKPGEPVSAT